MTAQYNGLAADPTNTASVTRASKPHPIPGAVSRRIYRTGGKRLLDLTVVLVTAPFMVAIVALLALIVAKDGGRPFYRQARVGRNGRLFHMWKLRSMIIDADTHLEAHLAANPLARAEWNSTQKLKNDPRITRFGRFLRRTSMDELPQLWNVFVGDMSLIGPRPMMPCQKPLYSGSVYYELRPGISGSWQVSARNTSAFADRVGFDTSYDRDLSLTGDLVLLVETLRVVGRATGY